MALKHKYGAIPKVFNGVRYPSRLEANCASVLEAMKTRGEVLFYLEQVPVRLLAGKKHRVDFLVFTPDHAFFIEAKGKDLPEGKKMRLMSQDAMAGVEIHVVTRPEQIHAVLQPL